MLIISAIIGIEGEREEEYNEKSLETILAFLRRKHEFRKNL